MGITDVVDKTYLKNTYLFGIKDVDDLGNPFPDQLYLSQVAKAALEIETETGLSLELVTVTAERHDLLGNDVLSSYLKALLKRPVRTFTRASIMRGTQELWVYPESWLIIRLPNQGLVQIIQSPESIGSLTVVGNVIHLRGPLNQGGYGAAELAVNYTAGFDGVTYPYPPDILDAVALLASALFLDTAGDLILGAGIAGYTVSQDGQSTSINSTSSATNSGYGARAGEYRRRAREAMARIRGRYRGIDVGAV